MTIAEMRERYGEGAPMTEATPDVRRGPEYVKRGMYGEALFSANVLLASNASLGIAWRLRGEALFGLERYGDADIAFARTAELGGGAEPGTTEWRALCHWRLGDIPRAQRLLLDYIQGRDVEAPELLRIQALLIELHKFAPTPGP